MTPITTQAACSPPVPDDHRPVAALRAESCSNDPGIAIPAIDALLRRVEAVARDVIRRALPARRADSHVTETAVHETVRVIAKRLGNDSIVFTERDLDAWTRAAAVTRAAAALGHHLQTSADSTVGVSGAEGEERWVLRAALGAMPDAARHILLRRAVDGATWSQLALELGVTRKEARRRAARARVEFRRRLAAMLDAPLGVDAALARALSRSRAA
jgi:DNA-directed RNA polymerase specialized sigma24 family protein